MAFEVASGTINVPASTGTQAIEGLGFSPKAVIFFNCQRTADGSGPDLQFSCGFVSSGVSQESVHAIYSRDGRTTSSLIRTRTRTLNSGSPPPWGILSLDDLTPVLAAQMSSFEADGFIINWITVTPGIDVYYLALGGDDLTDTLAKTLDMPTVAGDFSTTGVGFKPDCVLLWGTFFSFGNSITADYQSFLSFFTTADEATAHIHADNAQATSVTGRTQRTDRTIYQFSADGTSVHAEATFVSMEADGFKLNYSTAPSVASKVSFLALKGGNFFVGNDTQKITTPGTKSKTGLGFPPKATLFGSFNNVASVVRQDNARLSMGVGIPGGSSSRSTWVGDQDAATTTISNQDIDSTKCLKMLTEGTPTLDAAASFESNDALGFTLDWTTVDAIARQFIFLSFGNAGVPIPPSVFGRVDKATVTCRVVDKATVTCRVVDKATVTCRPVDSKKV